ncbi:MAG: alpha/beta fold hydrolase [Planctomycetia bacterium]|nr:alpha/beta fold hydrolase [Planctomycetia bacterium]
MSATSFPPFEPHPLLRSAHAQTLAGVYLPGHRFPYRATQHRVPLDDGDQIVLHDDCPADWRASDRSALLIHGLAGCHESGYMQRTAHKLNARGVRTFRMDLRGCGVGAGLARLPYHSGRSEDTAAALAAIARRIPQSPTTLIGFSLGANITLKLLGELESRPCGNLDSAVAVSPPVDLAACSRQMQKRANRMYDRHFVGLLVRQIETRHRLLSDAASVTFSRRPKTLWEFDNVFTAVVSGFGTAENYYRVASSAQFIPSIRTPTLIVASRDDPMIPCDGLERTRIPPGVDVRLTERGGHLGFVGRGGVDADRRWMDWRVVDWVLARNDLRAHRPRGIAVDMPDPARG